MAKLEGNIAVVTGGSAGLGRAIAEQFAKEGARVFIGDIDEVGGNEAAAHSEGRITFCRCDVSQASEVARLIDAAVDAGGRLDTLVNNAGIAIGPRPVYEMSEEELERQVAVNLTSMLYACKYALPHMVKQKSGSIINLGSMQGHVGIIGFTAYAATKGAALSMTRQLAVEFAPLGIRVNSISPGAIRTPMNDRIIAEKGEQLLNVWNRMHPLGRIGEPEEVGKAAVFLASTDSSFTTGADLKVDGGATIQVKDSLE